MERVGPPQERRRLLSIIYLGCHIEELDPQSFQLFVVIELDLIEFQKIIALRTLELHNPRSRKRKVS